MNRDIVLKEVGQNKIFSAKFIKKDGTERLMSCRLGVQKNLKNVGHKFDPATKGLLNVYDMHKKAYRFVNLETCSEIRANGKIITE